MRVCSMVSFCSAWMSGGMSTTPHVPCRRACSPCTSGCCHDTRGGARQVAQRAAVRLQLIHRPVNRVECEKLHDHFYTNFMVPLHFFYGIFMTSQRGSRILSSV